MLFPNVGKYYGGHFTYNGKAYPMGQHGFARDTEFEQIAAGEDFVTYRLCADEESKKKYPFDFVLEITHRLENNRLSVEWNVKNVDDKEMYFTIGGHPAFNVNILPDTDFEDYSLVFKEGIETLSYILIDAENGTALTDKTYKLELTNSKYALKKDMFDKDALIFDNGQIEWVGFCLLYTSRIFCLQTFSSYCRIERIFYMEEKRGRKNECKSKGNHLCSYWRNMLGIVRYRRETPF